MTDVQFTDNSVQVKGALEDAVLQWLEESADEIQSAAERNSDFAPRSLKQQWNHVVSKANHEATIGHPKELAIWMEFGTGEYALNNDGRKGYWVYVKGNSNMREKNPGETLTLAEAKRRMAYLREQGLDAHITKGHKPMRMLHNAFEKNKAKIIRRAEQILKGKME